MHSDQDSRLISCMSILAWQHGKLMMLILCPKPPTHLFWPNRHVGDDLRMGSRSTVPFALGVVSGLSTVVVLDRWRAPSGDKQPLEHRVASEETDASKYFRLIFIFTLTHLYSSDIP